MIRKYLSWKLCGPSTLGLLCGLLGCAAVPQEHANSSGGSVASRGELVPSRTGSGDADIIEDPATPVDFAGLAESGEVFVAFKTTDAEVAGTAIEAGGPGPNVMAVKLQDAINTLLDPQADEALHLKAVDQVMESLFTSNLVVLPTGGPAGPAVDPLVGEHEMMLQNAINALNQHTAPMGPGTPNSKDAAWEARNFLQLMQEALEVIGEQTGACNPQDLRNPACELLLAGDEGGVDIDHVYPGFSRQVRSPFFVGQESSQVIQEQVIVPGVIGLDECTVVLKEIQGVKAVVRKVTIPVWVEPWYARATIVGFTTVWVWEFLPAEFLKTITYCNDNGSVVQDVDIVTVLERELSHFWSFLNKDITVHP